MGDHSGGSLWRITLTHHSDGFCRVVPIEGMQMTSDNGGAGFSGWKPASRQSMQSRQTARPKAASRGDRDPVQIARGTASLGMAPGVAEAMCAIKA